MNVKVKYLLPSIILAPVIFISAHSQTNNPRAEISKGLIRAEFYLPDAQTGYYRGTRFDWSGVMSSLIYKGHQYFGQWFDKYNPVLHDAIMGPVEEFGPLGYAEAETGSSFVKIGIGILRKPEEDNYQRFGYYEMEDPGKWTIQKESDQITFIHELHHPDYGYTYTKTVKLLPGEPVMEILHSLKNNGQRIIEINVYDHNFFVMDSSVTGPGHCVIFPFNLEAEEVINDSIVKVKNNVIAFNRDIGKGETVLLAPITGFGNDAKDYNIKIENRSTGAGVKITGNKPFSSLIFWASLKVLSPEPYIDIRVEPGAVFTWKYTYKFYEVMDGI